MSIEQTSMIDFVNIDNASGDALLTISDHLDWDENEGRHLVLLQSKLNAYLRFIESGELCQKFPETDGRSIAILVAGKFRMSKKAEMFFERARTAIRDAGFKLRFELFAPS